LVWVGGLVTSYEAGMSVVDWPTTFGYNPLLYPLRSWLGGSWDVFIEHGHRLLGMLVGLLAIGTVAAARLERAGPTVNRVACALLGLVILQGVLGGLRVVLDQRVLALVHGCTGPAFFAFAAVTALELRWRAWPTVETTAGDASEAAARARTTGAAAAALAGVAFVQIALGACLRHGGTLFTASEFRIVLVFHLAVAALVAIQTALLFVQREELGRGAWCGWLLGPLVAGQLALGGATYVVNWGWPVLVREWELLPASWTAGHVVMAESTAQAVVTTGHVMFGSLILVASALGAWSGAGRFAALRRGSEPSRATSGGTIGAALVLAALGPAGGAA
jgi:cytochrome c oxidase assembly protein subunit 15